jgi:hypothetical protein
MSDDLFPSGPWRGFYYHAAHSDRHRMDLTLEFGNGRITGEGNDDIGPFIISGRYDSTSKECHWTKTYVRKHDVFYKGARAGKGIGGAWEIREVDRGGFRIWPLASGEGEDEVVTEALEQPVADAVGELVGAGAPGGDEL